jgi:acetyltransferase-like isoleucine patch superfamily enzyme
MNSKRLYVLNGLFPLLPPTRCFALKRFLLRWAGAQIGHNVRIASSAKFHLIGNLSIGDNTWIGEYTLIVGGDAEIAIGSNVDIGPRVTIVTGSHELFAAPNRAAGPGFSKPISIEDGVWIGANSTVLGGAKLENCSVVGAGALVKGLVSSRSIVGGVPAKAISRAIK